MGQAPTGSLLTSFVTLVAFGIPRSEAYLARLHSLNRATTRDDGDCPFLGDAMLRTGARWERFSGT